MFRSASEMGLLAIGLVTGAIVARTLGPTGKGVYSTLVLVIGILGHAATLGIDEGLIILVSRDRVTPKRVVRTALPAIGLASVLATLIYLAVAILAFPPLPDAAYVSVLGIPLFALAMLASGVLNVKERIALTSGAKLVARASGAGILVAIAWVGSMSLSTAFASELLALFLWASIVWSYLQRIGGHGSANTVVRTRRLLSISAPLQVSRLILSLSARFDLVVVAVLAGPRAGGLYSVALTVAQLGAFPAYTLSYAAFPRMTRPEGDQIEFIERVTRAGVAASVAACIVLALAVPWLIPLVFGEGFRESVPIALIALGGTIPWALMLLSGRALSALGHTRIPAQTLGGSLVAMVVLDALLVPELGSIGAALGALVAALFGVELCRRAYRRHLPGRSFFIQMLPRPADAGDMIRSFQQAISRRP